MLAPVFSHFFYALLWVIAYINNNIFSWWWPALPIHGFEQQQKTEYEYTKYDYACRDEPLHSSILNTYVVQYE